jgi:hemoglobin
MTAYELLGKEEGIRRLVDRFYEHMDTQPDAAVIRAMHAKDLTQSRHRLWMFLVGRFGGPQLYLEERGHPRLRGRHMPFAVDQAAADAWMLCMNLALEEQVEEGPARTELSAFFSMVANHMRNKA